MARPGALQFLKSGKLLTGAVFPRFVATWNWLVGAFDSMKGDGDLNPQQGFITIDRSNPDTPIIRFDSLKLPKQSGGGGAFTVEGTDDSTGVVGTGDPVGKLSFASASDSNITATVSDDSAGNVTVTLGVYYK